QCLLTLSCQLVTWQSTNRVSSSRIEARRQILREKFIRGARLTYRHCSAIALNFSVRCETSCRIPVNDTRASGKDIIVVYGHIGTTRDGRIEVLTRKIHQIE